MFGDRKMSWEEVPCPQALPLSRSVYKCRVASRLFSTSLLRIILLLFSSIKVWSGCLFRWLVISARIKLGTVKLVKHRVTMPVECERDQAADCVPAYKAWNQLVLMHGGWSQWGVKEVGAWSVLCWVKSLLMPYLLIYLASPDPWNHVVSVLRFLMKCFFYYTSFVLFFFF